LLDYQNISFGLQKDIIIDEPTRVECPIEGITSCLWTLPDGKSYEKPAFTHQFSLKPGSHDIKFRARLLNGVEINHTKKIWFSHKFGSDVNTSLNKEKL